MPEEPTPPARPAPLVLPSPAELGVSRPVVAPEIDWSLVHRRMQSLGSVCFHMEKLPQGGYRFLCLLPTSQTDRTHRIEVEAATEAEAVRLALEQAELWARK